MHGKVGAAQYGTMTRRQLISNAGRQALDSASRAARDGLRGCSWISLFPHVVMGLCLTPNDWLRDNGKAMRCVYNAFSGFVPFRFRRLRIMLKTFAISNFRSLNSVALEHLGRVTLVSGKNGSGKTTLLEALWLFNEPDAPELVARLHAFRGLSPAGLQSRFQDLFYGFNKQTRIKMTACGDWNDAPRELEISMQPRRGVSKVDLENMERSPSDQETSVRASSYDLVFRYRDEAANVYASRAWFENRPPSENGLEAGNQSLLQERQWVEGRAVSVFLPAIRRDTPQAIASRFGALQLEGREHEILPLLQLLAPRLDRLTSIALKGQPAVYAYFDGSAHPISGPVTGRRV